MADSISAMPKEITQWLNKQTDIFTDIKFITEFPAIPKATPLKNPFVSVGLESAKITDYFTENSEGELVPDEYCRLAEIRIRFSVYVPYSMGGTACHEAFTKTVDCLSFKSDFNIKEAGCEAISADRETDAFVMKSWIDIEAQFCPAESSEIQYEAFLPKTLFCRTHMNDTTVHISEEERNSWNKMVVSGAYFGTGSTTKSINLGFRPTAVIVATSNMPMYYVDPDGISYCVCGFAAKDFSSSGIELTSTGFKVKQSSSENYGSTVVQLNDLGIDYFYVALT